MHLVVKPSLIRLYKQTQGGSIKVTLRGRLVFVRGRACIYSRNAYQGVKLQCTLLQLQLLLTRQASSKPTIGRHLWASADRTNQTSQKPWNVLDQGQWCPLTLSWENCRTFAFRHGLKYSIHTRFDESLETFCTLIARRKWEYRSQSIPSPRLNKCFNTGHFPPIDSAHFSKIRSRLVNPFSVSDTKQWVLTDVHHCIDNKYHLTTPVFPASPTFPNAPSTFQSPLQSALLTPLQISPLPPILPHDFCFHSSIISPLYLPLFPPPRTNPSSTHSTSHLSLSSPISLTSLAAIQNPPSLCV